MKLRTLLMAGLVTMSLTLPSAALSLSVEGRDRTAQAKATAIHNTTYVSLRSVADMLVPGAQVDWRDGTAWVSTDQLTLSARPGDNYIQVNGRYIYMEHGVRAMDGSTMVAIRPFAAAMGGTVDWLGQTSTVVLTPGDGVPEEPAYAEDELYWLSRIISAESRGEPLLGKIAVGTVVLNRVAHDMFPDTIYGVIFDDRWGGQFEPVRNGTVYHDPTQESVMAAQLCLQGARAAGDSLYFFAPHLTDDRWISDNRTYVTTIGAHWFYR